MSGFSERLYIFESPIDAMSHASLEYAETGAWQKHSRLSLAGTTDMAIPFFLKQHTAVSNLVFCLDNDSAGQKAASNMVHKYADKGYLTSIQPPKGKDYNEDLLALRAQGKASKQAISRQYEER